MYARPVGQTYCRVMVSRDDVATFISKWPCANLGSGPYWFEFHRPYGDLVDTNIPVEHGGIAALALCQDAMEYARGRGLVG